jgi:hypothetical protein
MQKSARIRTTQEVEVLTMAREIRKQHHRLSMHDKPLKGSEMTEQRLWRYVMVSEPLVRGVTN